VSSRDAVARRISLGTPNEFSASRGRLTALEPAPACDDDPDRPAPLEGTRRLLSVEEVSKYLGVSERWVYEQVRTGNLPAMYIARSWRMRQEIVDTFAESFQWQPPEPKGESQPA
jgi:excisionase family DNA binding protein